MRERILATALAGTLTACAVTPLPPPPASHPASPAAAEAPVRPLPDRLAKDEATRTTESLLDPAQ